MSQSQLYKNHKKNNLSSIVKQKNSKRNVKKTRRKVRLEIKRKTKKDFPISQYRGLNLRKGIGNK